MEIILDEDDSDQGTTSWETARCRLTAVCWEKGGTLVIDARGARCGICGVAYGQPCPYALGGEE